MSSEEFNKIIDKYLAGQASPGEINLIDNFFRIQERHAFHENSCPGEDMWKVIENRLETEKPPLKKQAKTIRRVPVLIGTLTVVMLLVGLLYYKIGVKQEEGSIRWYTTEAAYGRKTTFTLSDGSKVFLNSGSSISYPQKFKPESREVLLTGEAFFEVSRNTHQPFIVITQNVTTKVLGTSFNIQAFEDQPVTVTVASGRVRVDAIHTSTPRNGKLGFSEGVILNPTQQAVFRDNQLIKNEVDTARFFAWRRNILRFEDAPLAEVMIELERWYNVNINFANKEISNCRINGQFKDQSLTSVLNSIQYMYSIDYRYERQNQIMLYGKGCNK